MQYQQSIALDRGCYIIEGSLYEKNDLNSNAGDAIVLDQFQQELVVGSGTCNDGTYTELVQQNEDNLTDFGEDEDSSVPGFGIILSLPQFCLHFLDRIRLKTRDSLFTTVLYRPTETHLYSKINACAHQFVAITDKLLTTIE